MYQELPQDLTLIRPLCLNLSNFHTLLLNFRHGLLRRLFGHTNFSPTLGCHKFPKISISLTTTRSPTSLSSGEYNVSRSLNSETSLEPDVFLGHMYDGTEAARSISGGIPRDIRGRPYWDWDRVQPRDGWL